MSQSNHPFSQMSLLPVRRSAYSRFKTSSTAKRARFASRSRSRSSTRRSVTPGGRYQASEGVSMMLSRTVANPSAPSPFARTARKTLRYGMVKFFTSTTGAAVYQTYALTSLYDPDVTNAGHQPYMFDQFCTSTGPYLNYRVLGARVAVECAGDTSANNEYPILFAMGPSSNSSGPPRSLDATGSISGLLELPGWTGGMVSPYTPSKTFRFNFDIAKLLGVPTRALETEDDYLGVYNGSPNVNYYFTIGIQAADVSNTVTSVITAFLEFDVKFQNVYSGEGPS